MVLRGFGPSGPCHRRSARGRRRLRRVSASGRTSPRLDVPWSPALPGNLGRGPEATAPERRGSGSGVGRGGSPTCAPRGESSPAAARHPAGTSVEREEDAWNLLDKLLWSTWATSKTETHINPPSDNIASHFSPGRKKRGEACLGSLASERETALRYCKTSPAHPQSNALWLGTAYLASSTRRRAGDEGLGASPAQRDYLICAGDEEEVIAMGNRCPPG